MRSLAFFAGMLVFATSACIQNPESCYWDPTHATLTSDFAGSVPRTVNVHAELDGRTCGCCGGKGQATVTSVRWFVDGKPVEAPGATTFTPGPHAVASLSVELTDRHERVVEIEHTDSDGAVDRERLAFFSGDAASAD